MSTERRFNFTTNAIAAIEPAPQNKRNYYYDTQLHFLELVVTDKGTKTFKFFKKEKGVPYRITIGNAEEVPINYAKRRAIEIYGEVTSDNNPYSKERKLQRKLTLKEFSKTFIEQHSMVKLKSWREQQKQIDQYLTPIIHKRLCEVTKQDIRELHTTLGANNGIYVANRVLALVRSMYNRAKEWDIEVNNPAERIKKFKEKARERFLQPEELSRFFKALEQETNTIGRDFIYMALFTGARRSNVLSMKWKDVNLTLKSWTIWDSKNGEDLIIPLIEPAMEVLERRKKENHCLKKENGYVFPSLVTDSHYNDPKSVWSRILRKAELENLRMHDLRRSMGSYQAILGASEYIIGKSLGHKSSAATAIYARLNINPVRQSMENAAKQMINYSNMPSAA